MKKVLPLLFFVLFMNTSFAQPAIDYAVQTWVIVETNPAKIILNWKPVNGATEYIIYRKLKTESSWETELATLDSSINFYEDLDVVENVSYEYKIEKKGNVTGFGYVNAGIGILPLHFKGNLLLLVDDLFSTSLSSEITQLSEDLVGDGWTVFRSDVSRDDSPENIKQIILDQNTDLPNNLQAVFCLGHIPVPYSGNYAADGHSNNHEGAWPSDSYYAELDGNWTDVSANNVTAAQERNHNVPGDGKFDQTFLPSDVELQIGRVDFANMPAFSQSEEELLRQYLNKNHAYKMGEIDVQMKAIIDDNFGGFNGEAFAASGWKSFAPLLHPDNVKSDDYRTAMDTASYIWSYGCGGGSYTSCSGVGNTNNLASDSLKGIFSSLFGSYFGDWDAQNNLMRATLAQGTILTNCWNGRPHWYFHHMGLGENIGYSTKVSMNNTSSIYNTPLGFLARLTSMGLMGDPSLRMYTIAAPSNLTASFDGENIDLNWSPSIDTEAGYYVYELDNVTNEYFLRTNDPIFTNNFTLPCIPLSGSYKYMVRATKLTATPSGSFHNLSQGIFATEDAVVTTPIASFSSSLNNGILSIENLSSNATNWFWDFGDGNSSTDFEPTHIYASNGVYTVNLVASNNCFEVEFSIDVSIVISAVSDLIAETGIHIYPNPVSNVLKLESRFPLNNADIFIYDSLGKLLKRTTWNDGIIDLEAIPELFVSGFYFVRIEHEGRVGTLKFIKD